MQIENKYRGDEIQNSSENVIEKKGELMDYKAMCIQQGYVPSTCQMNGQLCWLLVQEGKDPCKECNYNRAKCNGRHAPYESESYEFGLFVDAVLESQRKRD